MPFEGIGVVVRITFANASVSYIIQEFNTNAYFSYVGKNWHILEFGLYDGVRFKKLPGITYVVDVEKIYLKSEDPPQISVDDCINIDVNDDLNSENK